MIFSPGYGLSEYKNYHYLAEYFTEKGYVFISIQHDMPEDKDGLKTIDPKALQAEARKHLWIRGEANIFFVLSEIKKLFPNLDFDQFIIAGHSNGGDIAKFFAGNNPKMITNIIVMDARRCPLKPKTNLRILSFEANDTSTDLGVIPDEGTKENQKRTNLEWVIIKPKNALHASYLGDYITDEVKHSVLNSIEWFLDL